MKYNELVSFLFYPCCNLCFHELLSKITNNFKNLNFHTINILNND
jgi:hypothetical protein